MHKIDINSQVPGSILHKDFIAGSYKIRFPSSNFHNSDFKQRTLEIRKSVSATSPGDNGLLSKVKRCKRKKTEHGWFLSILTIFQNEVFETILKFIVDEEVVDKPLLLGGCLGLHHDGEGGAVVLRRKY